MIGLVMMRMIASGQYLFIKNLLYNYFIQHVANWYAILAFERNKSSRDIPGFLGIPAGINTISLPVNIVGKFDSPWKPKTWQGVLIWDRSMDVAGGLCGS